MGGSGTEIGVWCHAQLCGLEDLGGQALFLIFNWSYDVMWYTSCLDNASVRTKKNTCVSCKSPSNIVAVVYWVIHKNTNVVHWFTIVSPVVVYWVTHKNTTVVYWFVSRNLEGILRNTSPRFCNLLLLWWLKRYKSTQSTLRVLLNHCICQLNIPSLVPRALSLILDLWTVPKASPALATQFKGQVRG